MMNPSPKYDTTNDTNASEETRQYNTYNDNYDKNYYVVKCLFLCIL